MIQQLLDDIYHEDLADDPNRDHTIRERLRMFSTKYADLSELPTMDYHDPATRFAYVYRYVTCHANLVAERWAQVPELTALFQTPQPTLMACLGAGPGSEILGLLQAASLISPVVLPQLHVTLLDKHPVWAESWGTIFSHVRPPFAFSTTYVPWDVLHHSEPHHQWFHSDSHSDWYTMVHHRFFRSDWFTMVYFLSAIYKQRDRATPVLTRLFHHAKPGARIFYLDHAHPPFTEWMIQLAEAQGFSSTYHVPYDPPIVPRDEAPSDLGMYRDKFGMPQLTAKVAWGILTKSDPNQEGVIG